MTDCNEQRGVRDSLPSMAVFLRRNWLRSLVTGVCIGLMLNLCMLHLLEQPARAQVIKTSYEANSHTRSQAADPDASEYNINQAISLAHQVFTQQAFGESARNTSILLEFPVKEIGALAVISAAHGDMYIPAEVVGIGSYPQDTSGRYDLSGLDIVSSPQVEFLVLSLRYSGVDGERFVHGVYREYMPGAGILVPIHDQAIGDIAPRDGTDSDSDAVGGPTPTVVYCFEEDCECYYAPGPAIIIVVVCIPAKGKLLAGAGGVLFGGLGVYGLQTLRENAAEEQRIEDDIERCKSTADAAEENCRNICQTAYSHPCDQRECVACCQSVAWQEHRLCEDSEGNYMPDLAYFIPCHLINYQPYWMSDPSCPDKND